MKDSSAPTASRANTLRALVPTGGHLLALAVLLGTLAMVFTTWRHARDSELYSARLEFVAQATEVENLIRQRLVHFELVARGGTSLFATVTRPTPRQWQAFADGMDIRRRFPAMVALGFAAYVPRGQLGELQKQWQRSGYGLLDVRPHGVREIYGPILYLEPRTIANVNAIGFDMLSEPTRRQAMLDSRDSGQALLSGPVNLVQDGAEKFTGALLYLPFYRNGENPRTVAGRRASMQGWVTVPFRITLFVQGALGNAYQDARFRIFDTTGGTDELLFTSIAAQDKAPPAFTHALMLNRYGRQWRIEFDSPPVEQAAPGLARLDGTLALGLFASLLMYAIAWTLARTEARAHKIAARMTDDFGRSEQRFRSAMQYSAIGQALLNNEGRITVANPALGAIVGRDTAALVGQRFDSLFEDPQPAVARGHLSQQGAAAGEGAAGDLSDGDGDDSGRDHSDGNDSAEDGDGVRRITRRLHRAGGVPRHAQLTYAPVPGHVGESIHGLVQVEDVTERLRAQAQVQALNRTLEARVALRTRELSQVNQELEVFAYTVSHDLRAPLRAIDGFSRILVERHGPSLDDSGRDYLGRVRSAATRMGALIDAMLTMSRLTRSELKLEPLDLSRIAADIFDDLRLGDEARKVQSLVAPGLHAIGDAALLRNLLSNLLANAWKFTSGRDDALIEVGATAQGEFFVRDNGAGFDQSYVDKLFRPFQRLHQEAQFAGNGIGLASVKRIVDRHGGSIRAEGQEGVGATFYFTLPGDGSGS